MLDSGLDVGVGVEDEARRPEEHLELGDVVLFDLDLWVHRAFGQNVMDFEKLALSRPKIQIWPFLKSIEVYIAKSNIFLFLKQSWHFSVTSTWQPCWPQECP